MVFPGYKNNNTNDNHQNDIYCAIIHNNAIVRVHSGHLNERRSAPGGRQLV